MSDAPRQTTAISQLLPDQHGSAGVGCHPSIRTFPSSVAQANSETRGALRHESAHEERRNSLTDAVYVAEREGKLTLVESVITRQCSQVNARRQTAN